MSKNISALPAVASKYWSRSTVILAVVTISFYLVVYMIILCTERCRIKLNIASKKQNKIICSLTITIIFFSCFWCVCMGSVDIANIVKNQSVKEIMQSYAVSVYLSSIVNL
uniref:G_PROTEIN_RECEP_F1_2 domain-containing protein n=1 Tax=Heterorhabditis bacteriophora TaxID=37862 RepID=A0A1I7XV48_HETBA